MKKEKIKVSVDSTLGYIYSIRGLEVKHSPLSQTDLYTTLFSPSQYIRSFENDPHNITVSRTRYKNFLLMARRKSDVEIKMIGK